MQMLDHHEINNGHTLIALQWLGRQQIGCVPSGLPTTADCWWHLMQ